MPTFKILIYLFIIGFLSVKIASQCNHLIFCSEPILKAIAKSNIFKDSKSFVDLTLKVPIDEALRIFKA